MTDEQAAWEKHAEDEAKALALMLESPTRRVMVVIIAAESDPEGSVLLLHSVGDQPTTGAHLRQFIAGTERKLAWLRAKLFRRP